MKIVQILFFIFLFCFTINAQTNDWIRVQSDNGEFSIEIPSKYSFLYDKDGFSVSNMSVNYDLKNVYLVNAYKENTLLSFEIYDAEKNALNTIYDKEFDKDKGKASEIKQNGFIIKQIITKTVDYYSVRQFFLSKKYIYILTAATRNGENPTMKRFLESLIFKPNTIEPPANNVVLLSSLQPSKLEIIMKDVKKYTPNKDKTDKPKDPNLKSLIAFIKPPASYVDSARMKAVQGSIMLRCMFSEDGFIPKIEFVKILPEGLARQALFALLRLKFLPQEKDGLPQTTEKLIEYKFTLY